MLVEKAEYVGGWLMLQTPLRDAMRWLDGFKGGKEYDILPHIEKRSRNANSYAWALITNLASELGLPKEEVYRTAVKDIGGRTEILSMRTNAVQDFRRAFVNGHIGRDVEIIGSDGDHTEVVITYGSSDFDTRQMSQLIDSLVQDCLAVGIETKDPGYIRSLLEEWE